MNRSSAPVPPSIYARRFEAEYSRIEVRLRFFDARANGDPPAIDIVMTPSGARALLDLLRTCVAELDAPLRDDTA